MIEDGTAIGYGIQSSIEQLKNFKGSGKAIILLSDGINRSGRISPVDASKNASNFGIKIYPLVIGKSKNVPYPFTTEDGNIIIKKINIPVNISLLKKIADITGTEIVFTAENNEEFDKIFNEIDKLEPVTYRAEVYKQYNNLYLSSLKLSYILFILFLIITIFKQKIEF